MTQNNQVSHVVIDAQRINNACDAYFKWKDLNTYIKQNSTRGINMPDAISEPMGCYCLGLLWNRGNEVGDATDPKTGRKIEFKATSNYDGDLSSFGPRAKFDDLVFLRFNLNENKLEVYDLNINSEQLGEYPANSTQTIADQQREGRRPHIRIIEMFIERKGLKPNVIFDIRRAKIISKK